MDSTNNMRTNLYIDIYIKYHFLNGELIHPHNAMFAYCNHQRLYTATTLCKTNDRKTWYSSSFEKYIRFFLLFLFAMINLDTVQSKTL